MAEDLRALARTNRLVQAAGPGATTLPYAVVPFLAIGPEDRGSLAQVASEVFSRRVGALSSARRLLRDPTMRVMGRLLDGDGDRRGDLLSYLYFDPEFAAAAIELGQRDVAAVFAGVPDGEIPWQVSLPTRTTSGPGGP
jgi:NTE family protein